ncbi:hypothetical protein [Streptomyces sp. NRRL F-2580]|uniref:hypothetical protein n=1 Tax=Streptomyces sp. NRRL F-2580 TaxID=1463841 RepID=UPI0004CC8035|nr:hypothetical protein [Streptomyces sp. NRRL F-2580]
MSEPTEAHTSVIMASTEDEPLRAAERSAPFVAFPAVVAHITGPPAMSVPLFWSGSGLPVGVHFLGRVGDEGSPPPPRGARSNKPVPGPTAARTDPPLRRGTIRPPGPAWRKDAPRSPGNGDGHDGDDAG